jgi:MFS family permease
MSSRLLRWRFVRPADAVGTYYVLTGVATFCFTLCFTVGLVYMIVEVGLTPFQLVLVGTVLEVTCFLFEVPTGVVADRYSRRLSVLIGFALIGVGFLAGAVPSFPAILAAQVLCGMGSTFTSGATVAWITDEVGDEVISHVFTREQQIQMVAAFAGTVCAGGLSLLDIRLPLVLSGAGFLALTVWLALRMPERGFLPAPLVERQTFAAMLATARGPGAGEDSSGGPWSPGDQPAGGAGERGLRPPLATPSARSPHAARTPWLG